METNPKEVTFDFFNYKWSLVPDWAEKTQDIYRNWYLTRYGYRDMKGLSEFLSDKTDICEAGCGQARDSKMFAEANPRARILAVDQSEEALLVANQTLEGLSNCSTMRGDITEFSPEQSFDFISCDQVIHHTPDPGETLAHLYSLLKPGGVLNFCVCKKKNEYRELADDLIMDNAKNMSKNELWEFSRTVTEFAKALYDLGIKDVEFHGKRYENLQRYVHNHVFRAWYNPDLPFELCVSSNYDWFSQNPRLSADDVREKMLNRITGFKVLRFHEEDDAVISVSLQKTAE
jgi:SAM-dependent methyltransferase